MEYRIDIPAYTVEVEGLVVDLEEGAHRLEGAMKDGGVDEGELLLAAVGGGGEEMAMGVGGGSHLSRSQLEIGIKAGRGQARG
ncbi:hypothetical protein E2562_007520 [Oryza meyeriana var. granulata]|uniref:Uncharacterized protein n=1 Tax=Oryza meyeriana var. granulata TaxID=110450 RepID=A0A6G1DVI4_9ORYZ|nr:hypothetical protein E2562_007520 [Oryza meyeriana var. granulata]